MSIKSRRILAVCTTGYFNDRGCHVRIKHVLDKLSGDGEPTILCYSYGRNAGAGDIRRIKKVISPDRDIIGFEFIKLYLDSLIFIKSVKILRKEPIDEIICFTHEAGMIGLALKLIFRRHYNLDYQGSLLKEMTASNSVYSKMPFRFIINLFEKAVEKNADEIIYNTKFSFDSSSAKNKKIITDDYDFSIIEKKKSESCDFYNIGWVGLTTKVQGFDGFINLVENVLKKSPNVVFHIVGFPLTVQMKTRLEKIKERVKYYGKMEFEKLPKMLSEMDLCISTKGESSEGSSKLFLYKKYCTDVIALKSSVASELLDKGSLFDSLESMEKEILRRSEEKW